MLRGEAAHRVHAAAQRALQHLQNVNMLRLVPTGERGAARSGNTCTKGGKKTKKGDVMLVDQSARALDDLRARESEGGETDGGMERDSCRVSIPLLPALLRSSLVLPR